MASAATHQALAGYEPTHFERSVEALHNKLPCKVRSLFITLAFVRLHIGVMTVTVAHGCT